MIDPGQAAIGIIVLLVAVGALLYLFYSRTNAVEKTGYGSLIMLSLISLMIPVFWILESNGEAMSKLDQHTQAVQRGAQIYAQYCFQCHGTKGQGFKGPKLNNNPDVNKLSDDELIRIISSGVYDPASPGDPTKATMPAWSEQYGGPLTDNDIQYLFALIRSSDPNYLATNGYPNDNGFPLVAQYLQQNSPSAYQTAVTTESTGQFGTPMDMTKQKAITINIIQPPPGATCTPACFEFPNVKVKVGTVITWVNKSTTPHTVTAIVGTNIGSPKGAPQIFDSGAAKLIMPGETFTYTVTMAAYTFNPDHTVVYYCQVHPIMVAELTVVT